MMMGALDGLISVAAVMLGVGGGTADLNSMVSHITFFEIPEQATQREPERTSFL